MTVEITPDMFDCFLQAARRNKVQAFEIGDLKVTFNSLALIDNQPAGEMKVAVPPDPDKPKPMSYRGWTEEQLF
jgi:hypothetical protein